MHRNRRAKIVATVGPASGSAPMLEALFLAGVDTFRLNFSHGTHGDHAKVHAAIRALEQKVKRPIGILQDLQGPNIRVGTIKDQTYYRVIGAVALTLMIDLTVNWLKDQFPSRPSAPQAV